jgi:hypothetical protein
VKIGILFNCHGQGIAAALRQMLPHAQIEFFLLQRVQADQALRESTAAQLQECDHVISQGAARQWGPIASEALRQSVASYHELPPFAFRGFHPDMMRIMIRGASLASPTGAYHSRIAVAGYLAGLRVAETAALYNKLVFARLGYLDAYNLEAALLCERFSEHGVNATGMLRRLRAQGCFMHSYDHPKPGPLVEMARAACALMAERPMPVDLAGIEDFCELDAIHPVFPDIADAIGVPPEGMFRHNAQRGRPVVEISLADFVHGSFAKYDDMDPVVLQQADGVPEALLALGLPEQRIHPRARGACALLTWHGTLLRERPQGAPEDGTLHLPPSVSDADIPWLRVDIAAGAAVPALGAVTAAAPLDAGRVSLHRNGKYLSAESHSPAARFGREAAGDLESFLPVTQAQIASLKALLEATWVPESAPPGAAPLGVQLVAGPALAFGRGRIALQPDWPRALMPTPNGQARVAVTRDGEPVTLRQAGLAQAATVAAPIPTAPAQTLEMGRRLVVAGKPALLLPPYTVRLADRAWIDTHCGSPGGLSIDEPEPQMVLRREAGRLVGLAAWVDGAPAYAEAGVDVPQLAGPCVLIDHESDHQQAGSGSAAAAALVCIMRLLAIAPFLPPGTAVLRPWNAWVADGVTETWVALGFPALTIVEPPASLSAAADLMWAEGPIWSWPAEVLQAIRRSVVVPGAKGEARYFLAGAGPAIAEPRLFEKRLAALRFQQLNITSLPAAELATALGGAAALLGFGRDLRLSAFCPPGTRVIELAAPESHAEAGFDPASWRQSEALLLTHGVLPCEVDQGEIAIDPARLTALIRTLDFVK